MRRAALVVAVAALLAPACVFAAGGTGPDPATVATNLCSKLSDKLGDKFAKRFASVSDCVSQLTPVATSAIESCSGQTGPALKSCVQDAIRSAVQSTLKGGGGGSAAANLAAKVCTKLQSKNGAAFSKRFSSVSDCESTLQVAAETAIDGCKGASAPGSDAFKGCVKAALRAAFKKQ